jgi:hypothetical protein
MARAASGLDGQVLELPFKSRNPTYPIGARLQVEKRGLQLNYLIARQRTIIGVTTLMAMVTAMTIGPPFPTGRILHLPSGIHAWSCLSFVCFRASWPVDCCTCSRPQMAQGRNLWWRNDLGRYPRQRRRACRLGVMPAFDPADHAIVWAQENQYVKFRSSDQRRRVEPLRLGRPGASIASATSRKAFTSPARSEALVQRRPM